MSRTASKLKSCKLQKIISFRNTLSIVNPKDIAEFKSLPIDILSVFLRSRIYGKINPF